MRKTCVRVFFVSGRMAVGTTIAELPELMGFFPNLFLQIDIVIPSFVSYECISKSLPRIS